MGNTNRTISKGWTAIMIIVAALIIDQVIKICVKSHMYLGESIQITSWFYIDFIENKGMAFGMTLVNKMFLSIMRIAVSVLIGWYIWKQVRANARTRYVVFLSLILAGAMGNIIDSMFYGLIFTESTPYTIASLVPIGEGYASFLTGRVVDMFYFPIIDTTLPAWLPLWGEEHFVFFSPVFNFADSCVTVGVILLLVFARKDLEAISGDKKKARGAANINKENADEQ